MAQKLNDSNFENEVLKSDIPVMVDFYADWCGPCKMMGPVVEALSDEFEGKVKICKINIDESPATAEKYGVMSIPTFLFFEKGEVKDTVMGAVSKGELAMKLK